MVGITSLFTGSITVSAEESTGENPGQIVETTMDNGTEQRKTEDLAVAVESSTKGVKYGDYEYQVLEDNTVEITKYNGTEANVSIPSQIDGKDVTSIGNYAFSDCSSLISRPIPIMAKSKNLLSPLGTAKEKH